MKRLLLTVIAIFVSACFAQGQKGVAEPGYHSEAARLDTRTTDNKPALADLSGSSTAEVMPVRSTADVRWVISWGAAPDSEGPPLKAQSIRQIIRASVGGSSLRIRLSNLFGKAPVTIGPVRVAAHAGGSAIKPGSDRALTFGGKPSVTIAKGGSALSDPVKFPLAALAELAVSIFIPGSVELSTIHGTAIQTAFITPGDATAATTFPKGETDTSRFFLTDLEVVARADARAIVVVGDSITDGVGSTEDANARWPDALAARLQANAALASIAVVNSAISGNRILNDGADPFIGPSLLSRFERDALSKPGVRWIVMLSGGNDISAARLLATPKDKVSAEQIIEGMKTLIARAHQKGLKIFGATLTPKAGSRFFYAEGEVKRQAINAWIRSADAFDAVIDFDQLTRDPKQPDRLLPAFDSGDHLHLNDAGYKAMAALINLDLLSRSK